MEKTYKEKQTELITNLENYYPDFLTLNGYDDFIKHNTFKFFANENADLCDYYKNMLINEKYGFIAFLNVLGCFSKTKYIEKNGKEADYVLAQKASSFVAKAIKQDFTTLRDIIIACAPIKEVLGESKTDNFAIPNQRVLDYLSMKGQDGRYSNLDTLLTLNTTYDNIFLHVLRDFNRLKPTKQIINNTAVNYFLKTYFGVLYVGTNKGNADIAELYAKLGMPQETFDYACELRERAKKEKIPKHILGSSLKEKTIMDEIEFIKSNTQSLITDSNDRINALLQKEFTYEFLSKYDARNGVIGLFCDCCCYLDSQVYGEDIAQDTIINKHVQNIVVNDKYGNIVAKGAMYVNETLRFAVINDFELNTKYKADQTLEPLGGRYYLDSKGNKDRQAIFDAFERGAHAFAKKYDRLHPGHELQQINIGMGYNKLKAQCKALPLARKLYAPVEFLDADEDQYILYKRTIPTSKTKKSQTTTNNKPSSNQKLTKNNGGMSK